MTNKSVQNERAARRSGAMISVVIPVFNEESGIGKLAGRLSQVLSKLEYQFEIVVVDDGSVDGTWEQLRIWQENDSRLVTVKLSRNWGHQNAYNAGLDQAQGDAVIFMDGDLEDPPEVIPELLNGWEEGFDTVYTVKEIRFQSVVRRYLTNFYYWLIRTTTRYGAEPQSGMFSLIDQKVANVLRQMKESNKSYPNLRALAGFRQKRVIYSREKRAHGNPSQSVGSLISDGLNALFSNTYLPIHVFTIIGLFLSLFFILVGIIVLGVRITGLEFWIFRNIRGTQLILLAVMAFGSLQIAFLGVLGEYIARIYEEAKGRPYYIIEKINRGKSDR